MSHFGDADDDDRVASFDDCSAKYGTYHDLNLICSIKTTQLRQPFVVDDGDEDYY